MEAMHNLTTNSYPSAQRMCSAILKWVIPYMTRRQLKFLALDVAALSDHVRVLRFRETSGLDPGETICPVSFDEKQPLSVEIPLNPYTAPAIKELASSSAFSSVQQLIIFSSGNEHKLIPIFKACSSVKELIIDIHNAEIGALFSQSGSETAAPLFPYLHTIQMRDVCPPHWTWSMRSADYFPPIFEFLEHRVEIGFPVSLLDLSYHVDVDIDELPDHYISQLNDIKGLAIKLAPLISYDTDSQESD
ncbi:hypothetical protein D9613_011871 [Agrocybe pediades]|uniref:Uncharacterized protein n=1 Tax=Agrocybe pediades TaxID=84607 RepID=A0A8H4QKE6_9AGAR|nr:hypothetical protein D9613_011871 [Agrocybe pediades]